MCGARIEAFTEARTELKLLRNAALAAAVVLTCGNALAWAALATGDGNISFLSYNNPTKAQAQARALQGCQEMGTGCHLSGKAVDGTAFVVAKGRGGTGHASRADPLVAARLAMGQCQEVARDCKIVQAAWDAGQSWGALALGADAFFTVVNASEQAEAESSAIAGCEKNSAKQGTCKIVSGSTGSERSFYARAATETFAGFGVNSSAERAKQRAMEECNEGKAAGQSCSVVEVVENGGPKAEPASMKTVLARIGELNTKAPPRTTQVGTTSTNVLRCSNQCFNGMCVRTFENGRKEKWQAPRVYNPVTRNWEWDIMTNACGG